MHTVRGVLGKRTKKNFVVHMRLELMTFALLARRSAD